MSGPFDTADYTPGYRARIAQLEAENARLRSALEEISCHGDVKYCDGDCALWMQRVASEVLSSERTSA